MKLNPKAVCVSSLCVVKIIIYDGVYQIIQFTPNVSTLCCFNQMVVHTSNTWRTSIVSPVSLFVIPMTNDPGFLKWTVHDSALKKEKLSRSLQKDGTLKNSSDPWQQWELKLVMLANATCFVETHDTHIRLPKELGTKNTCMIYADEWHVVKEIWPITF